MFRQQFWVLARNRHAVKRRLVFIFLLEDAKKFFVAQPKRLPYEVILARNTNCLFARDIEFLDRWLRTVSVFTLMLCAAIYFYWQHLAVRLNANSIASVH